MNVSDNPTKKFNSLNQQPRQTPRQKIRTGVVDLQTKPRNQQPIRLISLCQNISSTQPYGLFLLLLNYLRTKCRIYTLKFEGAFERFVALVSFTNDEQRRFCRRLRENRICRRQQRKKHIVNLDDVWKISCYKTNLSNNTFYQTT
jgi:hypothetical protein